MGVYRDGARIDGAELARGELPGTPGLAEAVHDMAALAQSEPGSFAWLGLAQPTKPELALIGEVFGLEPLYLDDAVNPHQQTKLDHRDNYDFLVMKILTYIESTSDVETGHLSVFIGEWFFITVRLGPFGELESVRRELESEPKTLRHGTPAVLHAVLDRVVDGYLSVAEEINDDIEQLEASIFSPSPSDPESVYRLKRENLELRHAALPLSHIAQELSEQSRHIRPMTSRFDDINDHMIRVRDSTETNDSLLMALLMASTARQDLQQNSDMRKISAWVAIAAVPTMIAGVYGMNFENMPELRWKYGYLIVIGLMATVCFSLYRAFKRSGWL